MLTYDIILTNLASSAPFLRFPSNSINVNHETYVSER